jgi:hypothetical protein
MKHVKNEWRRSNSGMSLRRWVRAYVGHLMRYHPGADRRLLATDPVGGYAIRKGLV